MYELELPDGGGTVLARTEVLRPEDLGSAPGGYGGYEDVTALDTLAARFGSLKETIGRVGLAVRNAAGAAAPDEISATFGLELKAKAGKAVAVLADGEAQASISVTLTWYPSGTPERRTGAAAADA